MVEVRAATHDDLSELMRMAKTVHFAYGGKRWIMFEDNIADWILWFGGCIDTHGTHNLIFVAEEAPGKLCGFICASLGPIFCVGGSKVVYERIVWVDKDRRGKQIGKQLIEALCAVAKQIGCTDVYIGVSSRFPERQKIASIYKSLGFRFEESFYSRRL